MSEVPTAEQMRSHLTSMAHLVGRTQGDGEMFDRWLAAVKAEVWDEAYAAGVGDATGYGDGIGGTQNPYKEET